MAFSCFLRKLTTTREGSILSIFKLRIKLIYLDQVFLSIISIGDVDNHEEYYKEN